MKAWEVYKRDSQDCILFIDEDKAKNQEVFESDLISAVNVRLNEDELNEIAENGYLWC